MFRYLSTGKRDYAGSPIPVCRRSTWEFQAVLAGRIAPLLPQGPQVPVEATFWAFPPNAEHGWIGEPKRTAEVMVFHPLQVPALLELAAKAAADEGRFLAVSISAKEASWLRGTFAAASEASNRPGLSAPLRLERTIIDLSLFVLERIPPRWLPKPRPAPEALIFRVLAWLEDHLAEDVGIAEACAACGCSPAHLRRLFHARRGSSPRQALSDLRLQCADQCLADPSLPLTEVARRCGYADAASLCRTYRTQRGTTPRGMPRAGNPRRRSR